MDFSSHSVRNFALLPLAELLELRFIEQVSLPSGCGHRSTAPPAIADLLCVQEITVDGGAGS